MTRRLLPALCLLLVCASTAGAAPARGSERAAGKADKADKAEKVDQVDKPASKPSAAPVRKLVISAFTGSAGTKARNIALEIVAGRTDRTDYTVVGHDDVEMVAKRLGLSTASEKGRQAISSELAIDLWLEGELDDGGSGKLKLLDAQGVELAHLPIAERSAALAVVVLRDKIWPWLGALVSEDERIARKLGGERERALAKIEARQAELERQQKLVVDAEARRMRRLEAARARGSQKDVARQQELARQAELVRERRLAEAREQQRLEAEQQRMLAQEAERQRLAEQAALQQQQQQAAAAYAQPAQNQWQQPQPAAGAWQPPQNQWQQQPQPAASAWQQPQPAASNYQAPANQWQQQPQQPATGQQPQAQQPQPQPPPAAQPQPAANQAPAPDGISPETREWLERKRRERAAAPQ